MGFERERMGYVNDNTSLVVDVKKRENDSGGS